MVTQSTCRQLSQVYPTLSQLKETTPLVSEKMIISFPETRKTLENISNNQNFKSKSYSDSKGALL